MCPSIADVARQIYSAGGWKAFYKGFAPCMARALPASGVLLFTVCDVISFVSVG